MQVKSINTPNGKYFGSLIFSEDDNGYYVEIWKDRAPGEIQTGIHETPEQAWKEAQAIIKMENRR